MIKKFNENFDGDKKYIAYIKQDGEGCDYTIACGYKLIELRGGTIEEAREDLMKRMSPHGWDDEDDEDYDTSYSGEQALESATIYEVTSEEEFDTDEFYKSFKEREKLSKQDAADRKEREEYQRLHNKFGAK